MARSAFFRLFTAVLFLGLGLVPRPSFAQTGGVRGFVVDNFTNRIAGATVRVTSGPTTRRATSAQDGSYVINGLTPGRYSFVAQRAGYQNDTRNFTVTAGQSARLDFTLRANTQTNGVLHGTVVREGSRLAVPGVQVQVTASFVNRTALTAQDGTYRITGLAPGSYTVNVTRTGFVPQTRTAVTIRSGETTTANFVLQNRAAEQGSIQGRILDGNLRAVAGARIVLLQGNSQLAQTFSDSGGFYRFVELLPGSYGLSVTRENFAPQTVTGVAVTAGQRTTRDVVLQSLGAPSAAVEGFVVDAAGQAIARARMLVAAGPVNGQNVLTDATGFYRIANLPAGQYEIDAGATGYVTERQLVVLQAGQTTRQDFGLQLEANPQLGRIAGTVTRADGTPIPDVTVKISAGPTTTTNDVTDQNGQFSLESLVPGTYSVTFLLAGFQTRTVTSVTVTAGQTTTLEVILVSDGTNTGGTITGLVRNATSALVSNALVELLEGTTLRAATTTNASGVYSFAQVTPGTYSVRASLNGAQTTTVNGVTVTAGATTEVNVTLGGGNNGGNPGTIRGLVQDGTGAPVANARVELTGPASLTTITGADGRFTFTSVPAGSGYSVEASATGLSPATRSNLTVTAGGIVEITLVLLATDGTGAISGTVTDTRGLAIGRAIVGIVSGPTGRRSVSTTSQGRYNLAQLPAGTYTLEVQAAGFVPTRATVRVVAGQETVQNFFLVRQ